MGVSNYTPTGISHATSVDFSKRSVNQPVHIVQYDRSLPILAVSLYNNGQLYRLSEDMEVSIRLGKPDRTFVYNKALGCDSTRTIVYFEITQQMSLFDGEYYPVIEIMDGDKVANSSTIYLVVDRNPVQHDYIESTIEYKEVINYRDEAVEASKEAKESAKIASDSATTAVDKTKEAVEASETAVDAANSASESAESILGVEENVTRIGNMVSEKEPIITAAAETASTSATNARQSETNAKVSEEASKLSETNAKDSENKAKASEEASKLSETNAKDSETNAEKSKNESVKYGNLAKSYAVGTDNTIRENDAEDNAKKYCETAKYYAEQAKNASDVGALSEIVENHISDKIVHMTESEHDVVSKLGESAEGSLTYNGSEIKPSVATTESTGVVKPDGKSMSVDESGTLSINLDGTTITLDEAKNVIKLADTLKDKIGSALQPESIVNNQITTVEGFALDARQANPNIDGTLAKQLSNLNGSLMNNLFYGQNVSSIKDVDSVGLYYITNASEMPTGDPFIVYSLGIVGRSWNYPIFAFNSYSNYMLYIGRNMTNDGVSYAFSGWTQIKTN